VRKYSDEFKLGAVRSSQQPELQVKAVAAARCESARSRLPTTPATVSLARESGRW
jgi:transposase-like protein